MEKQLVFNKENAIAFYRMAYEGNPKKAVELYVGEQYIQHNPLVGDGKQPFIDYFERMHDEKIVHQKRAVNSETRSSTYITMRLILEKEVVIDKI